MDQRIDDKLLEIERFLDELESFVPEEFEEYNHDNVTKAASERYMEKIVEAVLDLTVLVLRQKGQNLGKDNKFIFDLLVQERIISQELAESFKDAKGMRNIIAHDYGIVDDHIVFNTVGQQLGHDVRSFIALIRQVA